MRLTSTTRRGARLLAACLLLAALPAASPAQERFDKDEFAARRAKLFDRIKDGVAVLFGAGVPGAPVKFRQAPDFYYLTGVEEPNAVLLLDGRSRATFLFVPKRSETEVMVSGPGIWQLEKAGEHYGVTAVLEPELFFPVFGQTAQSAEKLYVPVTSPDELQSARGEVLFRQVGRNRQPLFSAPPEHKRIVDALRQWAPHLRVADVNPHLDDLRWVKTPYEIERLRRAGAIGAEGVREAIKGTRPGMYEYEIEAVAQYVFTKRGARGVAFPAIVASGPNTITWHYERNDRQMRDGEIVYMDYGADYDYYTSDITRTWPVSGRFSAEQERMYRCILEARDAIVAAMRPGATVADLKNAAGAVYKKHGFEREFLATNRYVGHHVGISVHDVNPSTPNRPFEPGVVFNVEPLLEQRDKQVHFRLEDTVLVTATGAENLTAGVPASVEEIYALIRQRPLAGE